MKLKIPPAVQFLLFAILMFGITKLTGNQFTFPFQNSLVLVFLILGTIIGLTALLSFRKAKTSVNPLQPEKASQLVTSGLYQFTRNPMYLGLLLVLVALFFRFGNYFNIGVLFFYIWYITTFQIKPEEKVLTEIFGDDFITYCKKVRRWL